MKKLFLIPILCLVLLVGCKKVVVLHPIEKSDIFTIPAGAVVTIPKGTSVEYEDKKGKKTTFTWDEETSIPVEKDGAFVSNMYIEEVMKVLVDK